MHKLAQEGSDNPAARYHLIPDEVAHEGLAAALDEFYDISGDVLARLTGDATEIATRLAATSRNYQQTETELAQTFTEIVDNN